MKALSVAIYLAQLKGWQFAVLQRLSASSIVLLQTS